MQLHAQALGGRFPPNDDPLPTAEAVRDAPTAELRLDARLWAAYCRGWHEHAQAAALVSITVDDQHHSSGPERRPLAASRAKARPTALARPQSQVPRRPQQPARNQPQPAKEIVWKPQPARKPKQKPQPVRNSAQLPKPARGSSYRQQGPCQPPQPLSSSQPGNPHQRPERQLQMERKDPPPSTTTSSPQLLPPTSCPLADVSRSTGVQARVASPPLATCSAVVPCEDRRVSTPTVSPSPPIGSLPSLGEEPMEEDFGVDGSWVAS